MEVFVPCDEEGEEVVGSLQIQVSGQGNGEEGVEGSRMVGPQRLGFQMKWGQSLQQQGRGWSTFSQLYSFDRPKIQR